MSKKKTKEHVDKLKEKASATEKKEKESENPWPYCDELPTLMEPDKMSKSDIAKLKCIIDFSMQPIQHRDELLEIMKSGFFFSLE